MYLKDWFIYTNFSSPPRRQQCPFVKFRQIKSNSHFTVSYILLKNPPKTNQPNQKPQQNTKLPHSPTKILAASITEMKQKHENPKKSHVLINTKACVPLGTTIIAFWSSEIRISSLFPYWLFPHTPSTSLWWMLVQARVWKGEGNAGCSRSAWVYLWRNNAKSQTSHRDGCCT